MSGERCEECGRPWRSAYAVCTDCGMAVTAAALDDLRAGRRTATEALAAIRAAVGRPAAGQGRGPTDE